MATNIRAAVLGLGCSLNEFSPQGWDVTIGVNDIWRFVQTDVIVCLENFHALTTERLNIIRQSKPKSFYSQKVIWDTMPGFVKIDFLPGYPDRICTLDLPALHKSYCSPFVACEIAYRYYGATEIHLFGADFINHPRLDAVLCGHIKIHFQNLARALALKGCRIIVYGSGILAGQL